jgi:hypothetical protein
VHVGRRDHLHHGGPDDGDDSITGNAKFNPDPIEDETVNRRANNFSLFFSVFRAK